MTRFTQGLEAELPQLRRHARALTRDPGLGEDLLQESALRALEKRRLFRRGTNMGAWLRTIMRNLHVSEMRRRARQATPTDPDELISRVVQPPRQDRGVEIRALQSALGELSDVNRRMLLRVGLDGESYESVARDAGLPVGTVKSRISRARGQLRRHMDGVQPSRQGR